LTLARVDRRLEANGRDPRSNGLSKNQDFRVESDFAPSLAVTGRRLSPAEVGAN
jgi:hypothetical protein